MTAEDLEDKLPVEDGPTPCKWSFWCLGAVFFAMFANVLGAFVDFWGEVSVNFYRHSLWKEKHSVNTEMVKGFREQLAEL